MSNCINVYQKEYAFVGPESTKSIIRTGAFGPCYVVSFTAESENGQRFAAMAHIDDTTQVESISDIFDRFMENSVPLEDVKVIIMGGWRNHPESFKCGSKIISHIHKAGFRDVSIKNLFKKAFPATWEQVVSGDQKEFYFCGAQVKASTGETFLFKNFNKELESEGRRRAFEFSREYGNNMEQMGLEIPISEAVT